jgi:glycine hydroxymethyltransferase
MSALIVDAPVAVADPLAAVDALADGYTQFVTRDAMVLYAGMNIPSPRAARLLSLPLGAMPAMGQGKTREQPGVDVIVDIEAAAETAACRLFKADWAEVRLQSCTLANLAVYAAVCGVNDLMAITPASAGGHVSHQQRGVPGVMGLNTIDLPYSNADQCVDDAASAALIRAHRPKLVMLGASYVPRAFDFPQIVAAVREIGAVLAYDIAHVAGLVAGGGFGNPLEQGADLLTASTYKSLGGPPGGLIVGTFRIADLQTRVRQSAYPRMTANYDAARVAALAVSLAESEQHAVAYTQAMLANANALREALAREDLPALPGTTHHLVVPMADADAAAHRLAARGIVCGSIAVSGQPWPRGLRIGTQFLTRRGFQADDMATVANLFRQALRADIDAIDDASMRDVIATFMHTRTGIAFC